MQTASKISIAIGAVALAGLSCYGALVYYQGEQFSKIAANPTRYSGGKVDPSDLAVRVTDNGFLTKRFEVVQKFKDNAIVTMAGEAHFGLHPNIILKLVPFGDERLQTVIQNIEPVMNAQFNYRFLPLAAKMTTRAAAAEVGDIRYAIGASVADLTLDGALNAQGRYELRGMKTVFNLPDLQFSDASDDRFENKDLKIELSVSDQPTKPAELKVRVAHLDWQTRGESVRLENADANFSLTKHEAEIIQATDLQWNGLNVQSKNIRFNVISGNTQVDLYLPYQAELYGSLLQGIFGKSVCSFFANLCPKEPLSTEQTFKMLSAAFLNGTARLDLKPSQVKLEKEALDFQGFVKHSSDSPVFCGLDLKLVTQNRETQALVSMFVPRKTYDRPQPDTFTTKITLQAADGKLSAYANGKRIYSMRAPSL